jgi:16S rRNA (cytidine1402-2'-O)-methyltransferase
MTGRLYLVALPIGNLEDITLRAIKTLRQVAFIIAEDTRTTHKLLHRYRIKTPFSQSYYQGVETKRVPSLIALLKQGKDLALVSEAGTPLICDPGYPLVRAAIEAGVTVTPIPGPSAGISALVASGLPSDRFVFNGTVPRRTGDRRAYFQAIRQEKRTLVAYESPHRLLDTLETIAEILPKHRTLVLARELTKIHEEFLRGTADELLQTLHSRGEIKGECVLLVEGGKESRQAVKEEEGKELLALLREEGIHTKAALRILMYCLNLSRNAAYRLLHPD